MPRHRVYDGLQYNNNNNNNNSGDDDSSFTKKTPAVANCVNVIVRS
jgi:hypothetical protein